MQDAWRTFWPTMYSSFAGAHTVPDWVARLITSTCARSLPNASAVCTTSTSYFRASTRRIFEMVTCIHSTSRSLPCWSASATYTRRRASQPCVPESCFTTCRCAHNLAPAHANLDDLFPVYLESLEWTGTMTSSRTDCSLQRLMSSRIGYRIGSNIYIYIYTYTYIYIHIYIYI